MNCRLIIVLILMTTFSLQGCTAPEETGNDGTDVQYTPLNVTDGTDQQISNQAKETLDQFDEIQTIKAVNTPKKIIAAVEIDHFKRINMEKYKKKYQNALMKQFPDMIIELSTDKKLIIEIDRLEKFIKEQDISQKQLEIKVQKLIKLMNKKT